MSGEKESTGKKIAVSTVVNVATQAALLIGTTLLGWLTGSFSVVWEFAQAHPGEFAVCLILAFLIGLVAGQFARLLWMKHNGVTAERIKKLATQNAELTSKLVETNSAEARDRARIDEFTDAQLELMMRMADAPSPGLRLSYRSDDHTLAVGLMGPTRVVAIYDGESATTCIWHLVPEWNAWVRRQRREIENRLAKSK